MTMQTAIRGASIAAAAFLLSVLQLASASAQSTDGASRSELLTRVAKACQAEAERFCPYLGEDAMPQDRYICLRPYKTSASLGCRSAINAAAAQ